MNGEDLKSIIQAKVPGSATCSVPLCLAYLYDKGRITPIKSSTIKPTVEHADVIKVDDLELGDNVITDQYKCQVKGRSPHNKGGEDP